MWIFYIENIKRKTFCCKIKFPSLGECEIKMKTEFVNKIAKAQK